MKKSINGFTIVELLIVIVVIAILAAISIVAYNGIQDRAGLTRSLTDLKNMQKMIESYKSIHGNYPNTSNSWRISVDQPTDYIPSVSQEFGTSLPLAQYAATGGEYMYRSDGTEYKIMAHTGKYQTFCPKVRAQYPDMVPPIRDCWAYGFHSSGGSGL